LTATRGNNLQGQLSSADHDWKTGDGLPALSVRKSNFGAKIDDTGVEDLIKDIDGL
jgi:hypothetical protein